LGKIVVIAVGKAAWKMAECAQRIITCELGRRIDTGIVITKYAHSEGEIPGFEIYEAAHPVPDEAGVLATERVLAATAELKEEDCVLFLVSGGGSALFESPVCSLSSLAELTESLLASGADINEINAVRKRLSKVKGGRFAQHVFPAHVHTVALSDVLGSRLDTIASGPSVVDSTTCEQVLEIIEKYGLKFSDSVRDALFSETPKEIANESHFVGGSVSELCLAAKRWRL
jgi:hydroxypyruvate reductase